MTLAVVVVTPQLAFAGADRKYSGVAALSEFKAAKICSLETTDARGLITFAGVGARAGAEPLELSEWVTHVLRGHKRTLDQSLHTIAAAATEQKLHRLVEGHAFGFAGFVEGKMSLQTVTSRPDLFSIPVTGKPKKLDVPPSPSQSPFRVIRFNIPQNQRVLGILLGSGTRYVRGRVFLDFSRQASRASSKEVAGQRWAAMWSRLNRQVAMREVTVGAETMCAWRYAGGGGSHISYAADGSREKQSGMIPAVGQGMPISDIVGRLFGYFQEQMSDDPKDGFPEMNQEITDKLLRGISMNPRRKF